MRCLSVLSLLALSAQAALGAQSCRVFDYRSGDSYDLSALRKSSGSNWRAETSQYTFLLNVCDDLLPETITVSGISKSCNSTTQACQIDVKNPDQSPKRLGSNPVLTVKDAGELQLKMTGGDHCRKSDVDRSVSILFHCNPKAGLGTPKFVEEDNGCLYIFEWETSAACAQNTATPPPTGTKDCSVVSDQLRYDLTSLSLSRGNWMVRDGEYEYALNVCADVHEIPGCSGYGACQTKPSDPDFLKQLGTSAARPVMEDGVLKLKMTGGRSCHGGSTQRQATIIFTCLEGGSLGVPRFLEETDDCMYIFSWETSAACGEPLTSSCAVTDSENGKKVDLSPLVRTTGEKNHPAVTAVKDDTASYKINICAGLVSDDNPCRPGTSICQIPEGSTTGRSLGSSGSLIVSRGDVVMRYADGDLCPGTDERISSDIYFICDATAIASTPKLLSNKNNCQFLFNWRTVYACEGVTTTPGGEEPGKGMSGGSIAVIVLLTLVGAYLVGGVAYNRFVRGEKGLDQIPHFSLCQACYFTARERLSRPSTSGAIQI